ncbi:MAG: hypothetical protein DWP97_11330 [Calditrichaeota bacterium]|nr:MAG: hypothetical protein DWP97_11330 [Calditrichota bacterium]
MKKLLLPLFLLLCFIGCTKIDYLGEEYAPTSHVDVYYDEADITVEYKVMGEVIATAGDIVSAEKMQKDIKKKAMEKGADAVIILGFERYQSGSSTNFSEETKDTSKGTKTSGSSSTSSEEKKEIKAKFIKYL